MSRKRKSTDTDDIEDPALSKRNKADAKVTKPEQLDDSDGNSYWEVCTLHRLWLLYGLTDTITAFQ
jgi:hypothetical protein